MNHDNEPQYNNLICKKLFFWLLMAAIVLYFFGALGPSCGSLIFP